MSLQLRAFKPLQPTQNIAVQSTVSDINLTGVVGTMAIRLCNVGSQPVFILFREPSNVTEATLANAIPIPAGQTEIFTLPSGVSSISVIAASTGSTLYFTLGEGL